MTDKPRRGAGRPTAYKPEYVEQVSKLCALGATDIEIADFFGVAKSTLCKWRHEHPEFSDATKVGRAQADERVSRSLYAKAVGYSVDTEKIFMHQGEPVRVPTREHTPPDTVACIFWLKNRRPDLWSDRVNHAVEASIEAKNPRDVARAVIELLRLAGPKESTP